jgi:hypothetical protein
MDCEHVRIRRSEAPVKARPAEHERGQIIRVVVADVV